MPTDSSRHKILQQISETIKRRHIFAEKSTPLHAKIYKPILPDALTCFKNELEAISGKCIICKDEPDLYSKLKLFVEQKNFAYLYCRDSYIISQLKSHQIPFSNNETDFENMQGGITGCEFLVARTGSILVSSGSESGRQMNVFPPVHIVLAHVSQLVDYPEDAFKAIQEKYGAMLPSTLSTITGPSRTADIEKTLVLGAHGPKEFVVFLCNV